MRVFDHDKNFVLMCLLMLLTFKAIMKCRGFLFCFGKITEFLSSLFIGPAQRRKGIAKMHQQKYVLLEVSNKNKSIMHIASILKRLKRSVSRIASLYEHLTEITKKNCFFFALCEFSEFYLSLLKDHFLLCKLIWLEKNHRSKTVFISFNSYFCYWYLNGSVIGTWTVLLLVLKLFCYWYLKLLWQCFLSLCCRNQWR